MIAPLLALCAAGAVTASDRPQAAFVSLLPRATSAAIPPRATLLEGVERALRRGTALTLRSAEQLGLDPNTLEACPRAELLGCITAHVAARSTVEAAAIFTLVPLGEGRHRVALTLVDMAHARQALARGARLDDAELRAAAEDAIFAAAITLEPAVLDAGAEDALAAWVERALAARPIGEDPPRWRAPLAELTVRGLEEPMALAIDDAPRGVLTPELPWIRDVPAGAHHLALTGERTTATLEVQVSAGQTATVTAALVARAGERAALHTPLLIGGAAAAAVGVALAVVSAASAASVSHHCVARPRDVGASCEGLGWPGFGVDGDALPTLSSARVQRGPPLFPLGAGLFGAGGALVALETVGRDDQRSLWIDVAIAAASAAACAVVASVVAP